MEYAIELLIPVALGLWLGVWLHDQWGLPYGWAVVFAILGMAAGVGVMYKRAMLKYPPRDPKTMRLRPPPPDEEDDDAMGADSARSSDFWRSLKSRKPEDP